MNILTTAEALEIINRDLQRPITRQLFHQSILPLMLERGDARRLGRDTAVDGTEIICWAHYVAWRQRKIDAGELSSKHPYTIDEFWELNYGDLD